MNNNTNNTERQLALYEMAKRDGAKLMTKKNLYKEVGIPEGTGKDKFKKIKDVSAEELMSKYSITHADIQEFAESHLKENKTADMKSYKKSYREEHKEDIKDYNESYYEENKEEVPFAEQRELGKKVALERMEDDRIIALAKGLYELSVCQSQRDANHDDVFKLKTYLSDKALEVAEEIIKQRGDNQENPAKRAREIQERYRAGIASTEKEEDIYLFCVHKKTLRENFWFPTYKDYNKYPEKQRLVHPSAEELEQAIQFLRRIRAWEYFSIGIPNEDLRSNTTKWTSINGEETILFNKPEQEFYAVIPNHRQMIGEFEANLSTTYLRGVAGTYATTVNYVNNKEIEREKEAEVDPLFRTELVEEIKNEVASINGMLGFKKGDKFYIRFLDEKDGTAPRRWTSVISNSVNRERNENNFERDEYGKEFFKISNFDSVNGNHFDMNGAFIRFAKDILNSTMSESIYPTDKDIYEEIYNSAFKNKATLPFRWERTFYKGTNAEKTISIRDITKQAVIKMFCDVKTSARLSLKSYMDMKGLLNKVERMISIDERREMIKTVLNITYEEFMKKMRTALLNFFKCSTLIDERTKEKEIKVFEPGANLFILEAYVYAKMYKYFYGEGFECFNVYDDFHFNPEVKTATIDDFNAGYEYAITELNKLFRRYRIDVIHEYSNYYKYRDNNYLRNR